MSRLSLVLAIALAFSLAGPPPAALAQNQDTGETPQQPGQPTDSAPPAPLAIPASDIAIRSEGANVELAGLRSRLQPLPVVTLMADSLPGLAQAIGALREDPESEHLEELSTRRIRNLRQRWLGYKGLLDEEQAELASRSGTLEAVRDTLRQIRAVWERTEESAVEDDLPQATLGQIRSVLVAVGVADTLLRARIEVVLTLQNQIALEAIGVSEMLARVDVADEVARTRLFTQDSRPMWQAILSPEGAIVGVAKLRRSWRDDSAAVIRFARNYEERLYIHVALLIGLLILMIVLRRRSEDWAEEDRALETTAHIFARPFSAALLIALLINRWMYPQAPEVVFELAQLASLVPVLRLLPGLIPRRLWSALYVLAALFFMQMMAGFEPDASLVQRLLLLVTTGLAFAGLAWFLRSGIAVEFASRGRVWRALGGLSRAGLVVLGASLVANLLGYLSLANMLTRATLDSAYFGLVFFTGAHVVSGLVRVLLYTRFVGQLNAIRSRSSVLARRSTAIVNVGALVAWLVATLALFGVLQPLLGVLTALLTADLAIGSLSITLSGIIAFALAIYLAFFASRFIRSLLEEDVLSRIDLPRGVPGAISKIAHYFILAIGFFIALAAANFPLDRFALVAGAFSVGIGFGLQNVVNNFVSGLILMFERPIRVGDTIEVSSLRGEVKRIGIRSSTIRTFEGAEVIVPNANLISNEVINWTLSDRARRVDIAVGVAYGTDPNRVIDILLTVAREHADVVERPEPMALFRGFGDSALDFELRGWIRNFDDFLRVNSELGVAVNDALHEAGIEIPFPQRDLHLKSIPDQGAAESLKSLASADRDEIP